MKDGKIPSPNKLNDPEEFFEEDSEDSVDSQKKKDSPLAIPED